MVAKSLPRCRRARSRGGRPRPISARISGRRISGSSPSNRNNGRTPSRLSVRSGRRAPRITFRRGHTTCANRFVKQPGIVRDFDFFLSVEFPEDLSGPRLETEKRVLIGEVDEYVTPFEQFQWHCHECASESQLEPRPGYA